ASLLTDGNPDTYWATPDNVTTASLEIDLGDPTLINRIAIQEHIELGQRVREWQVDVRVDGEWCQVSEGTTIGHLRLARFDTVSADRLRLTIVDSAACPTIESLRAYATSSVNSN
ncbi:MAG: discoidin domain-containing protein, partial [Aeoliella sp.]